MAINKANSIEQAVYQACLANPAMDETLCGAVVRAVADDFIIDNREEAELATLIPRQMIGYFRELGSLLAKIHRASDVADQSDDGKVDILK